jgi:hypothetical protein
MGEAGWMPGWDDVIRYFEALAAASDRVETKVLGQSTEGRPYIVVAVSAPENVLPDARQRNREALAKLWDARHVSQEDVDSIVGESRSVGIVLASQHSNEIGAMLMTMQLAYDLAVATDQPTLDLLGATIALLVPSHNPDGIEMISKWYERWLGTPWEGVECRGSTTRMLVTTTIATGSCKRSRKPESTSTFTIGSTRRRCSTCIKWDA